MTFRQRGFDRRLPRPEPVQRCLEVVFADAVQPQSLAQAGVASGRVERPRGGQLGGGFEDAGGDHRQHQIALAAALAIEQPRQPQAFDGAEDGGDVAMGQRAGDGEGLGAAEGRGSSRLSGRGAGPQFFQGASGRDSVVVNHIHVTYMTTKYPQKRSSLSKSSTSYPARLELRPRTSRVIEQCATRSRKREKGGYGVPASPYAWLASSLGPSASAALSLLAYR